MSDIMHKCLRLQLELNKDVTMDTQRYGDGVDDRRQAYYDAVVINGVNI